MYHRCTAVQNSELSNVLVKCCSVSQEYRHAASTYRSSSPAASTATASPPSSEADTFRDTRKKLASKWQADAKCECSNGRVERVCEPTSDWFGSVNLTRARRTLVGGNRPLATAATGRRARWSLRSIQANIAPLWPLSLRLYRSAAIGTHTFEVTLYSNPYNTLVCHSACILQCFHQTNVYVLQYTYSRIIGGRWLWKLRGHTNSENINLGWLQWSKLKIIKNLGHVPPCPTNLIPSAHVTGTIACITALLLISQKNKS